MDESVLRDGVMAVFWAVFAAAGGLGAWRLRGARQRSLQMTGRPGPLAGSPSRRPGHWLAWTVSRSGEFHRRAAVVVQGATVTYEQPRGTPRWSVSAAELAVRLEKRPRDLARSVVLGHGVDTVRLEVSRDKRFPFLTLGIPYFGPRLDAYAFDLALTLTEAGAVVDVLDVPLDADEVERLRPFRPVT